VSESEEYTEFRLTDDEFSTILDALAYARENAIHSDGRVKFRQTQAQLIQQSDHHARNKRTESERFAEGESDAGE
jgi:hypothetical protein